MIAPPSAGLRQLALRKGRELWHGLAVLRSLRGGSRVVAFVLVAVFAQIFRNWLLLHAVGVDASFFDAIAVLIAVVTLGQLPVGPSVGAAAAVLILGSDGVAAAAAAGVLMTVTGHHRRAVLRRVGRRRPPVVGQPPQGPERRRWTLKAPQCRVRELDDRHEEVVDLAHDLDEAVEVDGLGHVGVGVQVVGAQDVLLGLGGRQHDHRDRAQRPGRP